MVMEEIEIREEKGTACEQNQAREDLSSIMMISRNEMALSR